MRKNSEPDVADGGWSKHASKAKESHKNVSFKFKSELIVNFDSHMPFSAILKPIGGIFIEIQRV